MGIVTATQGGPSDKAVDRHLTTVLFSSDPAADSLSLHPFNTAHQAQLFNWDTLAQLNSHLISFNKPLAILPSLIKCFL